MWSIMRTPRQRARSQSGYTLLEFAIILAVVGIFMGSFLQLYNVYVTDKMQKKTANNEALVVNAVGNYLIQHGRYPCPAPLNVLRSNTNYGMEPASCAYSAAYLTGTYPAPAVGVCANGICAEESERTINITPPNMATVPSVKPRVLRGAVPFRILGIPEEYTEDGYGMRLQYAVTEVLTMPETYQKNLGGISVIDGNGQSLIDPVGSAHFVVFSTGPDLAGGYSREGRAVAAVTGTRDYENVNTSSSNKAAIYSKAETAKAPGAAHFDDSITYYTSVETPLWRLTDSSGVNIRDLGASGVDSQVTVGSTLPPSGASIDVTGDIRAKLDTAVESMLITNNICSKDNADCFAIPLIGTPSPGAAPMQCPPGQYVTEISSGHVTCSSSAKITCGPGQTLMGIDGNGELQCTTISGCPATPKLVCSTNHTLPHGETGDIVTLRGGLVVDATQSPPALSHIQNFKCLPTGVWYMYWSTGGCSNTCPNAGTMTTGTQACNTWANSFLAWNTNSLPAPGGNWEGTITDSQNWSYEDDHIYWVYSGFDGDYTNLPGAYCVGLSFPGSRVQNCQCVNKSISGTRACPQGQNLGTITTANNWTCNASPAPVGVMPALNQGTWAVTDVSNTCACGAEPATTETLQCPSGYSGSYVRTRSKSCPSGVWTWNKTGPTGSDCPCDPTATETQTTACTGGSEVKQRTMNCVTNSFGSWTTISNTCGSVALKWTGGTQVGMGQTGPQKNSSCTTAGAQSSCWTYNGMGQSVSFSGCVCQ